MNLPPDSFYYALSFLFGAGLLWIIRSYIIRTDTILKQLSDTVADLKTMVAVHEQKHVEVDKRLEEKVNHAISRMDNALNKLNQTLALLNADYETPRRRRATQ